ncbi:hypothetical protein Btru_018016 [Bulinus truncatus]|nr:hypothetical protein Btru_018016 [Bulinus truncatus]
MYLLLYCWCLLFIAHLHLADPVHASLETVCNNTLTDSSGLILVPYNSSLTGVYCELTISVLPGDFIILSLHSIDCSSSLDVYDGNDTSSVIHRTCSPGCSSSYYSNSNSMLLTFTVGTNNVRRMMASYISFNGCTSWDCSQDINERPSPTACPEYSTGSTLKAALNVSVVKVYRCSVPGHCRVVEFD